MNFGVAIPFVDHLGFELVLFDAGESEIIYLLRPEHLNSFGVAHGGATMTLMVLPVGWIGEWHENPKPQWIVPLSGRWFVETMDGQRVVMGAGEISFGEDQGTKADVQGHRGHLSGTVGSEPAVLVTIQLDAASTVGRACHLQ